MSLMLNAVFTENGVPKTGLANVIIYIYDLSDNSLVVNGAAVSEVGMGGYKYNFASYDSAKDYFEVWDSVDLTGDERYAFASLRNTEDYTADIDFMLKIIRNKKELKKNGLIWELIIYDDDNATPILNKVLKDKNGNNISDLNTGTIAQEIATSV